MLAWLMKKEGIACPYHYKKKKVDQAIYAVFNHPKLGDSLTTVVTPFIIAGLYIFTQRTMKANK